MSLDPLKVYLLYLYSNSPKKFHDFCFTGKFETKFAYFIWNCGVIYQRMKNWTTLALQMCNNERTCGIYILRNARFALSLYVIDSHWCTKFDETRIMHMRPARAPIILLCCALVVRYKLLTREKNVDFKLFFLCVKWFIFSEEKFCILIINITLGINYLWRIVYSSLMWICSWRWFVAKFNLLARFYQVIIFPCVKMLLLIQQFFLFY